MRSIVSFAAACAAFVSAGALPASAAWECQGPAYVCGDAGSGAKHARAGRIAASASDFTSVGGTSGRASYYWQGTRTASGARFNPGGLTAAHRTLPFGTRVMVTNQANGKSVVVTINDRGPFIKGRIIDLSRGAAQAISMTGMGVAPVSISVLGRG